LLKSTQIVGHGWIFCCQNLDIADLHVSWFDAWPFGARAQKPSPLPGDTSGVESIAGNQKLHELAAAQVWSYDDVLACAISATLRSRSDRRDNN
jgi:hypothetical protein